MAQSGFLSRLFSRPRDEIVKTYEPTPRSSHCAASLVYCFAGRTDDFINAKTSLSTHIEVFDPCIETWLQRETAGDPPLGLYSGAFAASHSYLYHYGGHDGSSHHGDLSRFCPATMLWTNALRHSASGPMKKAGCGMICCGDTLGLFGGYTGSKLTDEFHLFDISKGLWSCPATTGTRPTPRDSFSFTEIDDHRGVLFAGALTGGVSSNDIYLVDLQLMEWSKLDLDGGPVPVEICGHAACCINVGDDHPLLLVTGGLDNDNCVLKDAWLLDIVARRWKELPVPEGFQPRYYHSLTAASLAQGITVVTAFGGYRKYFSDRIAETTLLQFERQSGQWGLTDVTLSSQLGREDRVREKRRKIEAARQQDTTAQPQATSPRAAQEQEQVLEQRAQEAERREQEAERRLREAEQRAQEAERRELEAERRVQFAERIQHEAELRAQEAEKRCHSAEERVRDTVLKHYETKRCHSAEERVRDTVLKHYETEGSLVEMEKKNGEEITELMHQLTQAEVKQGEAEGQALEAEKRSLEAEVNQSKAEKRALDAEVKQCKAEKRAMEAEVKQCKAEKRAMEAEVKQGEAKSQALESENRALVAEMNQSKAEKRALEAEVNQSKAKERALEARIKQCEAEQQVVVAEQRQKEMASRVRNAEVKELKVQKDLHTVQQRLHASEQRCHDATSREHAAMQRIKAVQSSLHQAEQLVRRTETEKQAAEQHVRQTEVILSRLQDQLHISEREFAERNYALRIELGEAEKTATESEAATQNALQAVDDAHNRIEELTQSLRESEAMVTEQQAARQTAEDRVQEMEGELEDLQTRMEEFQERAQQLETQWVVERGEIQLTEEEKGRGGWAVVRAANFRGLRVAAKCLHEQISEYYSDLFTREMNMAARLRHPNLVQFIGATRTGKMIILTELMPTSLRAVLEQRAREHKKLEQIEVISISLDVARALNYLHLTQPEPLIHRDISSANVLLEPGPNNSWKAKISDYGSVNLQRQLRTVGPGSPVYAAPEANTTDQQSPKMDIFSFGVLLIEMCSARFPEVAARQRLIRSIQYPHFVELIGRCMSREIGSRPSASEIITQLTQPPHHTSV